MSEQGSTLAELAAFIVKLDEARIAYQLTSVRQGAVMVHVAVPGERWEIEFFPDEPPAIEVFRSAEGVIVGEELLATLFTDFSD